MFVSKQRCFSMLNALGCFCTSRCRTARCSRKLTGHDALSAEEACATARGGNLLSRGFCFWRWAGIAFCSNWCRPAGCQTDPRTPPRARRGAPGAGPRIRTSCRRAGASQTLEGGAESRASTSAELRLVAAMLVGMLLLMVLLPQPESRLRRWSASARGVTGFIIIITHALPPSTHTLICRAALTAVHKVPVVTSIKLQ